MPKITSFRNRRKLIATSARPRLTALLEDVGKLTHGLLRSLDPDRLS